MSIPPGITVFCDPALTPAMRLLDGLSGLRLSPLSAPAPLMLAQLARHTRDDVLFTLATAMDQAETQNLVHPETRLDGFANRLVLAGLGNRITPPTGEPGLTALLSTARLAVTDPTIISGLDGRAILAANGMSAPKTQGTASTADAAFLVTTGAADLCLIYQTDAAADPRFIVIAPLTANPVFTNYACAVNKKSVSPNARAFLAMLQTQPARTKLRAAGLTVPS